MAETLNQQIVDGVTLRQLQARRVESQQRQAVWGLLALLEAELLTTLLVADPFAIAQLARRHRAVETLVTEELDPLITARYAQIARDVDALLVALAQRETRATQAIVNTVTGEETIVALPSEGAVRRAVTQALFPSPATATDLSTTGADWWTRQGVGVTQRLGDQMRVSVSLGEELSQVVAKVKGTQGNGFQDGLMAKARDDAARLLRIQTTNVLGEAHATVGRVNAGQGLVLEHSSILDAHTCLGSGTLLKTLNGSQPIATVKQGDIVYGGSGQPREVLATHTSEVTRCVRVRFSDGTIVFCTPEHQFLTQDFGWVEAQLLKKDMVLRTDSML